MSGNQSGVGLLPPPIPKRPPAPPPGWNVPPAPPPAAPNIEIPIQLLAALATFCTSLCLGNLFDGTRWWLLPVAGAIVVAGLAGEISRRVRGLAIVMPVVYLLAGWLYVIPVATRGSSFSSKISIWPSGTTWSALHSLATTGSNDIRALSVPVPERPGFLFLTVAGVFLIAAMVDAIAVALQRPAAAGLPLLALLAVPAAVIDRGVGLLAFLAACLSYLALLLASGRRRLARWARIPPGSRAGIRRVTGAEARRISAVCLVLALVVAFLIPRYSGIGHRGGGSGSGSATVIEPVVTLQQQLHSKAIQTLMIVHTNTPEYLRLTALEHFDGTTFTLGSLSAGANAKVSHGLPAVAPGPTQKVQATIDVLKVLHQRYLPVPYQPTNVDVKGDWRLAGRNFTIFSAQTDTSGAEYSVTSQVADPTADFLREKSATSDVPASVAPSTEPRSDLPPAVVRIADDLTRQYGTEYDKAAAIQAYLRSSKFTYDLNGAPTGPDALTDFLTTSPRGYCEQFAGAMVALARAEGIPARVAIGFTPGTQQGPGTWVITNHDAHSWPELWFPQAGWVRFEPTPRDASTDPPSYTLSTPDNSTPTPTPSASASASASTAPSDGGVSRKAEQAAPVTDVGTHSGGSGGAVVGWLAGIAGVIVLLLIPAVLRRIRRRRRLRRAGAAPALLWAEIVDTAVDLGLALPGNLSPRRLAQYWARLPSGERSMPETTRAVIEEVAYAEQLDRYAGGAKVAADTAARLRNGLRSWERYRSARSRWRARLAPQSLISAFSPWRALAAIRGFTQPVVDRMLRLPMKRPAGGEQA
jgi:transglutaminase-like putative cysteine protease